jgi:predicted protein tyrosine phosphatase
MASLHVCPLSRLEETVRDTGARHVVTLLSASSGLIRPASVPPEQHVTLIASDITEPMEGHILAGEDHVRKLIRFIETWDRQAPMVLHCYAGISRSTAAAYIAASVLNPQLDEVHLARRLRASSPSATPNPRLIALADHLLRRDGRMVSAIKAIGRGAEAFEGTPFELSYA